MKTHTLAALAVAAALIAAPARAQDAAPRFEVGVVGSGLLVAPLVDGPLGLVGGGPSITIGVTPRVRLDVRAQIVGPNEGSGVYGLYEALVRFPLGSPGNQRALSMTAGIVGSFSYYRVREYRTTLYDGSVIVYPARRDLHVALPRLGSAGIVHQRLLSRRLAMLLGADALVGSGAIVARGTMGLSFGLGKSR